MGNAMTEAILGAWDEDQAEGAKPDATLPDGTESVDEAPSAVVDESDEPSPSDEEAEVVVPSPGEEEPEDEEPSEEEVEEEEEPSGDDEAAEPEAFSSDDPTVQAFLARHDGSVDAALRDAARMESVMGRQGRELGQSRQRIQELEAQLEQATLFAQGAEMLSPEQVQWIEEATTSENPLGYIQAAVQAGEFGLARAVLDGAELPAAQIIRASQAVDRAEQLAQPVEEEEPQPLAHNLLLEVLVEHYPEMPKFETEMISTMQALGEGHPLVALARSNDPGEAAQGLIGLYEIARAKTATVSSTREQVKKGARQAADAARSAAQVSSPQASPRREQVPRETQVMPGLSLEALDAEFANE